MIFIKSRMGKNQKKQLNIIEEYIDPLEYLKELNMKSPINIKKIRGGKSR